MIKVLSPQLIVQTRYKYMTPEIATCRLKFLLPDYFLFWFCTFVPALCACYVM